MVLVSERTLIELTGYLASALVAGSMVMKSVLRLRLINTLGALTFVAYGVLIRAWPVVLMNALIAGINVVRVRALMRQGGESPPSE
jgi:hypothetical protein